MKPKAEPRHMVFEFGRTVTYNFKAMKIGFNFDATDSELSAVEGFLLCEAVVRAKLGKPQLQPELVEKLCKRVFGHSLSKFCTASGVNDPSDK